MENAIKRIVTDAAVIIIVGFVAGKFFSKTERVEIPVINTVHDTVHDTLKIKVPKTVVTSDTVNLVVREVVHDTTIVNVTNGATTWPLLSFRWRNDSSEVTTFSLENGRGVSNYIYTKGLMVTGLWATSRSTPRIDLAPIPQPDKLTLLQRLKWSAGGALAVVAAQSVFGRCK